MEESPQIIAYCHACGGAMTVTAVAPFSNVECPACGKHTRVKREFGRYTLTRHLAVGGMSMVFVAQDNTLGREVALKILSEAYSADEKRIAAFEEEARLTASLSHPNIVRVYTTGRTFGRFYIAMELVPGGHFEHHIRERGQIPEEELLPLAIEVAQGLKAAHNAGLIHRDVKPGNILLDADGHGKLVDFGLALVTQGGTAKAAEIWATPYYVPPETIQGHNEDFRSDIYAFGATLYHALTGHPSCAEETMATDVLRAAKKKIVPLAAIKHSSSEETRRVIDRAMAYEPAARYQSYDALIADLETALARLSSGVSGRLREAAARRKIHHHKQRKILILSAIAVAILAIAGLTTFFLLRSPGKPGRGPTTGNGPAPAVPRDTSAEMTKAYGDARAALAGRDFHAAASGFSALFSNGAIKEPTRTWTGIESVIACYLDGRAADARAMAETVSKHIDSLSQNPGIPKEFNPLLAGLSRANPLRVPEMGNGAPTVIAAMLAGLKNWEQGFIGPATDCFQIAKEVKLPAESQWIAAYQEIAADYLHDAALLDTPVFNSLPTDRTKCHQAVATLAAIPARLKTKGRARFNVLAWEYDVRRHRRLLEKNSSATPHDSGKPKTSHLPEALALVAKFRFADAADLLENATDPEAASLAAIARSAANFVTDLEDDLKKSAVAVPIRLRDGSTAKRLALESPGKLQVTLADGTIRNATWADLAPDSFIDLHRLLVVNLPEADRLARHERAIAIDWLIGDRNRANEAAAKLSSSSPAFKSRWESIVRNLSKLPELPH
ncbi:MAG: serine/threonine-protein kinase [Verrucomicrobiota bacterium]